MIVLIKSGGANTMRIEMAADYEDILDTINAMLRLVGNQDQETPLTDAELYRICRLIEAMLPAPDQVCFKNAN